MSLDKAAYGKIFFWDHEIADLKEIAPSFDALLTRIKESPYVAEPAKKSGFWSKIFGKFQFF
jgi:hypothetical protein